MTTTLEPPAVATVRMRRVMGAAALMVLVMLVTAQLVGARTDVRSQASLQASLDDNAVRMFIAWVLTVLGGLAWLGLITGMRRMLPGCGARDLFLAAGVAGRHGMGRCVIEHGGRCSGCSRHSAVGVPRNW